MSRVEDVATERVDQVQPLIPERKTSLPLNVGAIKVVVGTVEKLREF
jgi:hypothetical protein